MLDVQLPSLRSRQPHRGRDDITDLTAVELRAGFSLDPLADLIPGLDMPFLFGLVEEGVEDVDLLLLA